MSQNAADSGIPKEETIPQTERKIRINFDVPLSVSETVNQLAKRLGTTKSEFFRRAINLMEIALDERSKGNKLAIADRDNNVLERIVGF